MLWAFDILPAPNKDGEVRLPNDKAFVGGLVSRPQPFEMRLVPRSADVVKIVEASAAEADVELEGWD